VLRKEGNQLNLFANGKPLGQLPENGMLSANRIYFGVNVAPNTKLIIDKISAESKDGKGVVVR
jgi:hypothetical protein